MWYTDTQTHTHTHTHIHYGWLWWMTWWKWWWLCMWRCLRDALSPLASPTTRWLLRLESDRDRIRLWSNLCKVSSAQSGSNMAGLFMSRLATAISVAGDSRPSRCLGAKMKSWYWGTRVEWPLQAVVVASSTFKWKCGFLVLCFPPLVLPWCLLVPPRPKLSLCLRWWEWAWVSIPSSCSTQPVVLRRRRATVFSSSRVTYFVPLESWMWNPSCCSSTSSVDLGLDCCTALDGLGRGAMLSPKLSRHLLQTVCEWECLDAALLTLFSGRPGQLSSSDTSTGVSFEDDFASFFFLALPWWPCVVCSQWFLCLPLQSQCLR